MIERATVRPGGGQTHGADAPDDDLFSRIALWLADVAAEAAQAARAPVVEAQVMGPELEPGPPGGQAR